MESFIIYLVKTSCISIILYAGYYLFLRKDKNLRVNRLVLLSIILFSILIPLNPFSIQTTLMGVEESPQKAIIYQESSALNQQVMLPEIKQPPTRNSNVETLYSVLTICKWVYFSISSILFLRLLIGIAYILALYIRGKKYNENKNNIIETALIKNSFSFFWWIFINKDGKTASDIHKILLHEKIHSSQWHSADLILSEFFIIFFWFNPASWLIKNSLRQVHEYLADEAILNSNVDIQEYQQLLVRVAAEDIQLSLTSNFSYSIIKNRLTMMTKSPSKGISRWKVLGLIPLMLALGIVMAFRKKETPAPIPLSPATTISIPQNQNEVQISVPESKGGNNSSNKAGNHKGSNPVSVAIAPTKMNVLFIGIDNPIDIVVGNSVKGKLDVTIDKGEIIGSKGKYIVRITEPSESAMIKVYQNNQEIYAQAFRVKPVPNAVVRIPGISHWISKKKDLKGLGNIEAYFPSDFDMNVKVESFEMSFGIYDSTEAINGCTQNAKGFTTMSSYNGRFTYYMTQALDKLVPYTKIYIEQVRVILPDGTRKKAEGTTYVLTE